MIATMSFMNDLPFSTHLVNAGSTSNAGGPLHNRARIVWWIRLLQRRNACVRQGVEPARRKIAERLIEDSECSILERIKFELNGGPAVSSCKRQRF
jgi:hypothetical protein